LRLRCNCKSAFLSLRNIGRWIWHWRYFLVDWRRLVFLRRWLRTLVSCLVRLHLDIRYISQLLIALFGLTGAWGGLGLYPYTLWSY
jgi:hypothetical protein